MRCMLRGAPPRSLSQRAQRWPAVVYLVQPPHSLSTGWLISYACHLRHPATYRLVGHAAGITNATACASTRASFADARTLSPSRELAQPRLPGAAPHAATAPACAHVGSVGGQSRVRCAFFSYRVRLLSPSFRVHSLSPCLAQSLPPLPKAFQRNRACTTRPTRRMHVVLGWCATSRARPLMR